MRALCEAPQMMLHYANIPYEYKMVWDHYGSSWAEVKKDIIFNRLPILIINEDKYLWQSNTIIRYLSNLTKTKPSDEFQLAYCDAVFESTHEMFSPLNPTINMTFGEKYNSNKKKLLEEILPNSLQIIAKILPLVHIFEEMRNILMTESVDYFNIFKSIFISLIYFVFGVIVFYISYYGAKKRGTLINMGE